MELRNEMFQRNEYIDIDKTSKKELIKSELPYGIWTLKDNTVFLFNRYYENLIGKNSNGELITIHPDFWHGKENPIIKHEYFYKDFTSPVRNKKMLERVIRIKNEFLRGKEIPEIIKESIVFTIDN
jgi:hypothetical protein